MAEVEKIDLGRYSVRIEKCGDRVIAPMNSTTFGCLSLNMISTCETTITVELKKRLK